ncbi:late embryogenesis abundant protein Lea5-A-like [Macadamia integrifolia]|uniref:late embryogenesis abundant protein Lea5-A-like n=1 Tax=Macadamia integrifolia TaxID=60698 RepID=UPI001C532B82|nr:late embryogenesis abundant protein Lea5-A-like [Macadamia integrifolia]
MARSLSNAKFVSALVDSISVSINRRGYAAASQGVATSVVRGSGGRSGLVKGGDERVAMKETKSWAPDPVTGYYRPENCGAEIDVAELRETLLNNKNREL